MQTLVSVGPYRFHIAAAGQSVRSRASAATGKDLAGEEHEPGRL